MVANHLKKDAKKKPASLEEFISQGEVEKSEKEVEFKPSPEEILLTFAGKINREQECHKKPILLHLKNENARDIQKYCHGNKQGIINYLIRCGLDELIKKGELKLIME